MCTAWPGLRKMTHPHDRGKPRKIEENRGRSRKTEENRGDRGRSRKIDEDRGRSRKIKEDRGRTRKTSRKIEENRGQDRGKSRKQKRSRKIEENRRRLRKIEEFDVRKSRALLATLGFRKISFLADIRVVESLGLPNGFPGLLCQLLVSSPLWVRSLCRSSHSFA